LPEGLKERNVMTTLEGRVVLVTGGGRGIGRAHCLELAAQGAAVVVNDPGVSRDGTAADDSGGPAAQVVSEIEQAGGKAVAHTGSVSSWDDVADMVATAVSQFGALTGVVNNAGIVRDAMITGATEADFDAVIGVHLKGTFAVTKHACDYWRAEAKQGNPIDARIVNTVSGAGLWGNVGQSAYGAAKAAIARCGVTALRSMQFRHWRRRGSARTSSVTPVRPTQRWIPRAAHRWWPGYSRPSRRG
jgi:NAD(P)-dependent dehydrogenase (short-subunit alcohol dehydrogenase family)